MKAPPLRIDERNHVEKPLLDQLAELGWEILDLDNKQRPADSFRESFAEVVMLPVLRGRLKVINPWLEEDQIEEAVKLLTDGFPGTGLIENNRRVLDLLLENTSVGENRRTGERSPTVRFVDFEQRENNRFIAVCQFKVRIPGTEHHVIPDIVLFLNGLPVVVVECKSPKVKDAIPEAIDQLLRYGDQRGARGEGSAHLFHYNQFLVATCRQEAKFGTITTRGEKDFYRWADPYPRTVDDLEHGAGGPNDQQRLVAGMLDDRYTMRQSIEDGVTLRIVYEGRTHKAEVPDRAAMDTAFEDVFSDYDLQERLQILGYGSRDAYLEAESTIEAKARDMVEHYLTHVYPNGYKAQVVATSRETAVRYKTHIDAALRIVVAKLEQANPGRLDPERLKAMRTEVVISGSHNDPPHLKAHSDPSRHETSIKSFKLPFGGEDAGVSGDTGVLIVNDMLLTGFDAPVEQVMYLDKVVRAHNLLQAIARVNRVAGESKDRGFVIDYVGIGHHLKQAIDAYDEREQKEVIDTLSFPEDELRELESGFGAIMDLLRRNGLDDPSDHDAFFDAFYDEDLRFEFLLAFKKLTRSLNLVFPARQALDYLQDFHAPAEVNVLAGKHFRDERLSMKGVPPPGRYTPYLRVRAGRYGRPGACRACRRGCIQSASTRSPCRWRRRPCSPNGANHESRCSNIRAARTSRTPAPAPAAAAAPFRA